MNGSDMNQWLIKVWCGPCDVHAIVHHIDQVLRPWAGTEHVYFTVTANTQPEALELARIALQSSHCAERDIRWARRQTTNNCP
jgi:hypothetical protein